MKPGYASIAETKSPTARGESPRARLLGAYQNDRLLQVLLLAAMIVIYGVILGAFRLPAKFYPLNFTFNSMLEHLLHGQFDVDPQTVTFEGFLRNGHVYAYWGVWCALIRLPLWLTHRMDLDVTTWSCLVAVCLAGMAKVRTVLFIRRHSPRNSTSDVAYGLMLLYFLLGGSEISYLRESLYQEVVFWAAAFGAIFVYFAVKGLVNRRFDSKTLFWMAVVAGLALLTRVSTGIGLCMALGLLLAVLFIQVATTVSDKSSSRMSRVVGALTESRLLLSFGVLVMFVAIAGAINFFRWGNPMTFANYHLYIGNKFFTDRMPRMSRYGLFNIGRIPFGLIYYFFPIWVLSGSSGELLFSNTQRQMMDAVELPPSSFFLTDLLAIGFIAFLAIWLWTHRSRVISLWQWLAIAIGLTAPCILMLTAVSMNYRYRMEFYPEIDLLALLGLYVTVTDGKLLAVFARYRRWMVAALSLTIVAAFAALTLYKLSAMGPSYPFLTHGVAQYYLVTFKSVLRIP